MTGKSDLVKATCPECRGPLTDIEEDEQVHEYVCLVGHRYSPKTLLQAHSSTQESALWAAVVALEEARNLVRSVSGQFSPEVAEHLARQAETKYNQAQEVRRIIEHLEAFQTQ